MKTISSVKLFLVVLSLFKFISFFGQSDIEQKENYKWFDNIIGIGNTGLYNGIKYKEQYRSVEGNHQFFLSSKFLIGNIIYNGQPYFDIEMKYNIYSDELIVRIPGKNGLISIQLINEKIENFTINNHQFIQILNINKQEISKKNSGLYEILFQSIYLTLYKKHKKSIEKMLDKEVAYYKFENENIYLIYTKGSYNKIIAKRDLIKLFPQQKKNINKFYSSNRKLINSNIIEFMIRLTRYINSLINNPTLN